MFARLITRLTCALLKGAHLSVQDRTLLTAAMLDTLNAFPLSDILSIDEEGKMLLQGKPVEYTQARALREGARAILRMPTEKVIRDAILFKAIVMGIHQGDSPEKVMFSKVAIWFVQERDTFLHMLAGTTASDEEV